DFLERSHRRAPRLGFALLELMDRPLRHTDTEAELTLTPAEHRARQANLGGEGIALELEELGEITRLPCHLNRHLPERRNFTRTYPRRLPAGGFIVRPLSDQG